MTTKCGSNTPRVSGCTVKGALLIVPDPVGFESVLPAGDAGAGPRVPVGSMIAEPADDVGWRV